MQDNPPKASRRGFFLTASVAGAAVASVNLLRAPASVPVAEVARPAPEKGGGYTLSAHVKKYYKTTLV
ncbi:MAG TPA: formate dehydrogenase [Burkholderiaceae bacterium]|nr:formate dehydrogenase [Rhodoferax sp.]MBP6493017.1 formate dehydrogenase [Rhodoferax sp.]HNW01310.1 formate dehydrogenase [Burkholderiaceae bacterium]HPW07025.1 formate dehydrogenase [Burkholderiaceae bacterium]